MADPEPGPRLTRRAVEQGSLSIAAEQECQAIQSQLDALGMRIRIGSILLLKRYLTPEALASLLRATDRPGSPAIDLVRLTPAENERLGRVLRTVGVLPGGVLDLAERASHVLAGHGIELSGPEILIETGRLDAAAVRLHLSETDRLPAAEVESVDDSGIQPVIDESEYRGCGRQLLGRLAIDLGLAPVRAVYDSLRVQILLREIGLERRLGRILIARQHLTESQLARLLQLQSDRNIGPTPAERDRLADLGLDRSLAWFEQLRQSCAAGAEEIDPEEEPQRPGPRVRLGQLAVFNRLLDPADLEACLDLQARLAGRGYEIRLGRLLIERLHLSRRQIDALLRAQAESPEGADSELPLWKFSPDEDRTILARVEAQQLVTPADLDWAEDIRLHLERAGVEKTKTEILLDSERLQAAGIEDLLAGYASRRRRFDVTSKAPDDALALAHDPLLRDLESPADDDLRSRLATIRGFRFGRVAAGRGYLTREQVRDALVLQLRLRELGIDRSIGNVLVETGALEPADRDRILAIQRRNRNRIPWAELADPTILDDRQTRLAGFLVGRQILSVDQVNESLHACHMAGELGLSIEFQEVLVERGFIDSDLLVAIEAELERRAGGEGHIASRRLRRAYAEVLAHDAARWTPPPRPRRTRVAIAASAAAFLLAVATAVLAGRSVAQDGPDQAEAPLVEPAAPDDAIVREGRILELAVFPTGVDGRDRFDFFLVDGNEAYHVRGVVEGHDSLDDLRRAEDRRARIRLAGTWRHDPDAPSVRLPNGRASHAHIEFGSAEVIEEPTGIAPGPPGD